METEVQTTDAAAVGTRIDHRTGQRIFVYDAGFWGRHVEERSRLGVSVHEYCTGRGLALSTFRRWAQRLGKGEGRVKHSRSAKAVAFVELPISAGAREPVHASVEVSLASGVRVKVQGKAAERVLALVLASVERAARA